MIRSVILCTLLNCSLLLKGVAGISADFSPVSYPGNEISQQVPREDYQLLYNGKIWKNLYYNIEGDEYLFSKDFLTASVTMNGKKFDSLNLRYDIYNDELILKVNSATSIQLNKEMVTSFTLDYNNTIYNFRKLSTTSQNAPSGYINILYEGKTNLYLKYRKEILLLAVDHKYDQFNQKQHLYLNKDNQYYKISGKRDFLMLLVDQKNKIGEYIRSENIKIKKNRPESFIPVLKYYDSLR